VTAGSESFWTGTPTQRAERLLDPGSFSPAAAAGSLRWGTGEVDGGLVRVAATDPRVARGAIGVAEAAGLSDLFVAARADRTPVLLLLDSSGARVDEGLSALGAFRRMFRAALLARLAGVPMLALLGRACFGGASMLACLCDKRAYLTDTRLATSGPAVIEAVAGKASFDARNAEQVMALMSGASRVRMDPGGTLVEDGVEAMRTTVSAAIQEVGATSTGWEPWSSHAVLGERLAAAQLRAPVSAASPALRARLGALLPVGYTSSLRGEVFVALPPAASGKPVFLGTLSGAPVGAATCWELAEVLLQLDAYPDSPVVLLLDADGHAATLADEQVLLSAYIVHLSLSIAWVSARVHRTVLWIPGKASGASYVAFAAAVERVSALSSAQIEILPAAAARKIVGDQRLVESTENLVAAGVADALLDSRISPYDQIESAKP